MTELLFDGPAAQYDESGHERMLERNSLPTFAELSAQKPQSQTEQDVATDADLEIWLAIQEAWGRDSEAALRQLGNSALHHPA